MEGRDDLDDIIIVTCVKSMQHSVKACIDASGGHIKY